MQAGWSTAPQNIRALGFGAGMGLPNIKKYSDEKLRNIKSRKLVKEYLEENIDSYVKEKDFKSVLKIIGEAEVSKKLNFKVHRISKKTKELVEKAGGKVEILERKSYSTVARNNKKKEK